MQQLCNLPTLLVFLAVVVAAVVATEVAMLYDQFAILAEVLAGDVDIAQLAGDADIAQLDGTTKHLLRARLGTRSI